MTSPAPDELRRRRRCLGVDRRRCGRASVGGASVMRPCRAGPSSRSVWVGCGLQAGAWAAPCAAPPSRSASAWVWLPATARRRWLLQEVVDVGLTPSDRCDVDLTSTSRRSAGPRSALEVRDTNGRTAAMTCGEAYRSTRGLNWALGPVSSRPGHRTLSWEYRSRPRLRHGGAGQHHYGPAARAAISMTAGAHWPPLKPLDAVRFVGDQHHASCGGTASL